MAVLEGAQAEDAQAVEPRTPDIDRDPAASHHDTGIKLLLQKRYVEAEAYLRAALGLLPDDADILNALGMAIWRQNRADEAEAIYRQAWQFDSNNYKVLANLGLALQDQGRLGEAAECYRMALKIQPDGFEAIMNLGVIFSDEGSFDEAMGWLVAAHQLRPDSADALQNIGMNLARLGRWDEAIVIYDEALRRDPESPQLHRNLAYALLASGNYERGWSEHEWRFKCPDYVGSRVNRTFWNGDDFQGQKILLHAEQGFGDTLQFIRFAPMVKRRGGKVVVQCPAPLLRLVARCDGVDMAVDASSFVPDCHIHAPMLSLPAIFGTTMATVPAQVPYLATDPMLVEHWRSLLARALGIESDRGSSATERTARGAAANPFLIGIAWQGNPAHRADRWRSFPLAQFSSLAELAGVRLVSLQTEHGLDQLHACAGRFAVTELNGPRRGDFTTTAAIMTHLDLVITPDTAVAHLAGGLGVRVWVGISSVSDWRWPCGRDDTPWYPTMRLFRQTKFGDWDRVFRRMRSALERELPRPDSCLESVTSTANGW
jgi:tetratricopeptide (TPR) repeat protein